MKNLGVTILIEMGEEEGIEIAINKNDHHDAIQIYSSEVLKIMQIAEYKPITFQYFEFL